MGAVGTHTLIQKITVGSAGAASVTFSSIPQTGYTDLKIVISVRTNYSGSNYGYIDLAFNGSTANYSNRRALGYATAANSSTQTFFGVPQNDDAATASTFSNTEIYIPGYTSSNYKSVSTDSVTENNSAAAESAFCSLNAGLWSITSAITSLTFSLYSGYGSLINKYSTFSLYGITTSSVPASPTPQAQGGDIIVNDGTYWYHAFISTGAFVPKRALTADVLVVAGGGGAGGGNQGAAGGGGAGGFVYTASQSFANGTSYTTTVGGGGAGGISSTNGTAGVNSNITGGLLSLTAAVGGGASNVVGTGNSGGSGSGASMGSVNLSYSGGAGTSGQGNAGGTAQVPSGSGGTLTYAAAGGGGAGAVGGTGTTGGPSGNGGVGVNTYSSWLSVTGLGVSNYIAGGGGGGAGREGSGSNISSGTGGSGGGGAGGARAVGSDATANTGSGGGGGGYVNPTAYAGGAGGSGVIIIRYKI